MDEDKNSQLPAGDQEGEKQPEGQGGPSDEFKMKRLEEDARKAKEERDQIAREKEELLESQRLAERKSMPDDERFKVDRDDFYRDKAKADTLNALGADLEGVPESVKKRISEDPFKWIDRDVLQFELMKVDTEDPAQVWEATSKAAKKSLPSFISDLKVGEGKPAEGDKAMGSNPAIIEGDQLSNPDALWSMPMDELKAMKNKLN